MAREIKFRVWNPKYKEFSTWGFMSDGHFKGIPTGSHMSIDECRQYSQQFTGLKDKNGVEIYEGDIIALHGKVVAVIIWRDFGGWCFQWIDKSFKRVRQDVEPVFHNTSIWAEVIGNVHQNPELLNTKP